MKTTITTLNDVLQDGTYIIKTGIDVENGTNSAYKFPENVTLIFTEDGYLYSNNDSRKFRLLGNNTTIIAGPTTIFNKNIDVTSSVEWTQNLDASIAAKTKTIKTWNFEYAYPEWFEKDGDDDAIVINKALLMNCVYIGEWYVADIYLKSNPYSSGYIDVQDLATLACKDHCLDYTLQKFGSFSYSGTVKLLNKTYNIKSPIIIKGSNLIGSSVKGSVIKCASNGIWDIKRRTHYNDKFSYFFHTWKRAAIILPIMYFNNSYSNSSINISNFTLNLNNCETNGMILERVLDNSKILDINIDDVNVFYSALKIEPIAFKYYDILCDYKNDDFVPIPLSNKNFYNTLSSALNLSDNNEGICLLRVYSTVYQEDDLWIVNVSHTLPNNAKINEKIYGAFPTNVLKAKLLGNDVTEYEMFTPNGANGGKLLLKSVNETTINCCGFASTPCNVYNCATGVCVEMINCNRINVCNGGAGFCRVGFLIRSIGRTCNGFNFTDNIFEGMNNYIIATLVTVINNIGSINLISIKGNNYLNTGDTSFSNLTKGCHFIQGPGGYHTIIDYKWQVRLRLKNLYDSNSVIVKKTYKNSDTVLIDKSTEMLLEPTLVISIPGKYHNVIIELLTLRYNNTTAINDKFYLNQLINSLLKFEGIYTTQLPFDSILIAPSTLNNNSEITIEDSTLNIQPIITRSI